MERTDWWMGASWVWSPELPVLTEKAFALKRPSRTGLTGYVVLGKHPNLSEPLLHRLKQSETKAIM